MVSLSDPMDISKPSLDASGSLNFPPSAPLSTLQEWLGVPATTDPESLIQSLDQQQYIQDFWQQRTRPDGRLFSQGRPCKVVFGISQPHAAGSALVTIVSSDASTKILAATTLQVGQPSPEQPDRGDIVVQVTGTGGNNLGMDFLGGGGKSKQSWDVLQSWLQRTMEEQDHILQRLSLWTGKAALRLVVTVQILEDGGNLWDAALLACMAAWKDTAVPQLGKDLVEVQGTLYWKDTMAASSTTSKEREDRSQSFRVSLTMGVWKNPVGNSTHLLVDPSLQEEPFLEGTLIVTIGIASGKLQAKYTGSAPLAATDLAFATKLAQARADELSNILSY
jgi:exosome complex component RRP43